MKKGQILDKQVIIKPKRNELGQIQKGYTGNPLGRPPGQTLKEYQAQKFRNMTEKEKDEWLAANLVSGELKWRMAEGNPANATDITSQGEKIIVMPAELINKNDTSQGTK